LSGNVGFTHKSGLKPQDHSLRSSKCCRRVAEKDEVAKNMVLWL
jgi:hypothetical protein